MASAALEGLLAGLEEVKDLQRANPAPTGEISMRPRVTRAINRASVVMLSSHFEKYIYAINEEAVLLVNGAVVVADVLPEPLKLQHSQKAVDDLAKTQWENRADQLRTYAATEAWIWVAGASGSVRHERLLTWMKTPKAQPIVRFYRLWGIKDIFADITRSPITRNRMMLKLDELVGKRNNIAHGDRHADATPQDLTAYRNTVRIFCERADRAMFGVISRRMKIVCSWY